MFPRTISILRPTRNTGVGAQGYGSSSTAGETVLFSGLSAEVQLVRRVGHPAPGVPADASLMGYDIYIQNAVLPLSAGLRRGDIVVDDTGQRYQISGAEWNVLGWRLMTVLQEA